MNSVPENVRWCVVKALLCLVVFFVSGCAIVTYECKPQPDSSHAIGETFLLGEDSFLLENSCSGLLSTKESCFRIQVAGGNVTYNNGNYLSTAQLPVSFADFEKRPAYYNNKYVNRLKLFGITTNEKRQDIVGLAPKGDVITITNIVSAAWGESGRCYEVYGELIQGSKKFLVEMPSCNLYMLDADPLWFDGDPANLDDCKVFPVPKSKYLISED